LAGDSCVRVKGSKPSVQCTFDSSTDPFTAGSVFFHIRKGGVSLIRLLVLVFRFVLWVFHFVEIFFLSIVIGYLVRSISASIVSFVALSVLYYVIPVLSMTVAWGVAIFCMQYLYLHVNMASALMAGLALALVRFGLEKLVRFTRTKK
jgi:hypothetical protein